MLRTLLRNIVANWVGYAVQILVTFFLTPFVLHTLGDVRYGAWALVMGMTGYYGLLDLGFRAGMTQYITRYLATKEFDKLNETASTGMTVMSLLGCLVAVASLIVCWLAPAIFNFPPEHITEIRYGILLVGAFTAGQFPFYCFSAALTAAQRFDITNGIGITTRLISAGLTVWLLKAGYGLIGIGVAVLAANLVDYVLKVFAVRRAIPELHISFGRFSREAFSEFFVYGIWNILIAGSRRLISYTDVLVIGLFLPVAAVAPYALAASLVEYFNRFLMPISRVFFPAATQLDASGDRKRLTEMYLIGSRLLLSLAVVIGTIAFVWVDDFFRLWVGESYLQKNEFASSGFLFRVLIVAAIVTTSQRIGYQVFLGARLVKPLATILFLEAIANLSLSCLAAPRWGLQGVAVATLIPACIVQCVILPVMTARHLQLSAAALSIHIYGRPLLLAAFTIAAATFWQSHTLPPQQWADLIFHGGVTAVICLPALVLICLTVVERQRFFGRHAARFFARVESLLLRVR